MADPRFVFVGEKRSPTAIAMGVRWEDGKLAARTLTEALAAIGVAADRQRFVNLYRDGAAWRVNHAGVRAVRELAAGGEVVVGLGRRVQGALVGLGVDHLALTHPAARGRIRRRDRYHAHVAAVIGAGL